MPASAFLLAFAGAWIHGVSNVFVGRRQELEAALAFMLVVDVIAHAPIAVITWDVDAAAIPHIAASAALELGYFAFLAAGYRISGVSLVYPVAHGGWRTSTSRGPVHVLVRESLSPSRPERPRQRRTRLRAMKSTFAGRSARRRIR